MAPEDAPDDEPDLARRLDDITLTPSQHDRLKSTVYSSQRLQEFRTIEDRYLVAGAGESAPGNRHERRTAVRDRLAARENATALFLEGLGIGRSEVALWCRAFDILCAESSWTVAVIEAHDGGVVWELGLLFAYEYREKTWVLKRRYDDTDTERERYNNPMAASQSQTLQHAERLLEWSDRTELLKRVNELP
jgi:hypothetical protein